MARQKIPPIEDVFQPTVAPSFTYIDRLLSPTETYRGRLEKALRTPGRLISISGPSKSGKTVLCSKSIEPDRLLIVSGAHIQRQEDFWTQLAEKIEWPAEVERTKTKSSRSGTQSADKGRDGLPVASVGGDLTSAEITEEGTSIKKKELRSNNALMDHLRAGGIVLVIDDFHYIRPEIQMYIARILKTELFNGLRAVVISLPHRSDDAVNRNPDLIGRTVFIQIAPWSRSELEEIAVKGFGVLKYDVPRETVSKLALESATSPQLMQENCLNLAYAVSESGDMPDYGMLTLKAFHDSAENYRHIYDEIIAVISEGPERGAKPRKLYNLTDGAKTPIYPLLIKILALDPPQVTFGLDEIKDRIKSKLSAADKTLQENSYLTRAIDQIIRMAQKCRPGEDIIDRRGHILYILDPFFIFYLRWK